MPSNWSIVDNNFPNMDRGERPAVMVEKMMNYMTLLVEHLKYTLENLGKDNWNEKELESVKAETTEKVEQEVNDMSGDLSGTKLTVEEMTAKLGELERENQLLQEQVATMEEELGKALTDLDTLFTLITPHEDGSFTIGKEGLALDLVGSVTVNGQEVGS